MPSLIHTATGSVSTELAHHHLRRMLVDWRRDPLNQIPNKIRDVREEGVVNINHQSTDAGETAETDPEDDLPFALLEMKTQVLNRITQAVRRLDDGTYGYCMDCGDAIAASRLRALPFAVRCRDCEDLREQSDHRRCAAARHLGSTVCFGMEH